MLKLNFPVFDIGIYPKTWYEDTKLFGASKAGVFGLIDDTSIKGGIHTRRIAITDKADFPIANIGKPYENELDLILYIRPKSKIIDDTGRIYQLNKKSKRWVLAFPIHDALYIGDKFLIKFDGTTTRITQEQPLKENAKFGLFLQTENSGEVFIGYSPYSIEERIRV